MSRLLIHGGRVIDPSQKLDRAADVAVVDGKISAIEDPQKPSPAEFDQTIDAAGMWVLPGLIDAHVHFREPGGDHKETIASGAAAAVAGGFTSVACMANTQPTNDNRVVTAEINSASQHAGLCRVFPIGAVTVGLKGEKLAAIGEMASEGIVAISDDGMPVMNSQVMRRAMEYAESLDLPVISHAEDGHLVNRGPMNEGVASFEMGLAGNPNEAEEIMIAREIALARLTGAHVHIGHLSTGRGVELVRQAKKEGLRVTAEACPHHLTQTDTECLGYNTHCKMAPPLRSEEDTKILQAGLADGTIDMIATDHAPHAPFEKGRPFAQASFGITGVQTVVASTYALVRAESLSLERWVHSMTEAPAQLLGLDLGTLQPGKEADITVFDPRQEWKLDRETNLSKSVNSPLWDQPLLGGVRSTIVQGHVVWDGERVHSHPSIDPFSARRNA